MVLPCHCPSVVLRSILGVTVEVAEGWVGVSDLVGSETSPFVLLVVIGVDTVVLVVVVSEVAGLDVAVPVPLSVSADACSVLSADAVET